MAIITISGGEYSGMKELAECLAKRLDYQMIDHNDVFDRAEKKYGLERNRMEKLLETPLSFWETFKKERRLCMSVCEAALFDAVKEGNVVYHGRGGHLFLKSSNLHRVLLLAPIDYRVQRLMDLKNVTMEKAVRTIKDGDKLHSRWTKSLFGVDWNDVTRYDTVFHLDKDTLEHACEKLETIAKKKDETWDRNNQIELENLRLASHVIASLATNSSTAGVKIGVKANQGVIHLFGSVKNMNNLNNVVAIVSAINGVKKIVRDNLDALL